MYCQQGLIPVLYVWLSALILMVCFDCHTYVHCCVCQCVCLSICLSHVYVGLLCTFTLISTDVTYFFSQFLLVQITFRGPHKVFAHSTELPDKPITGVSSSKSETTFLYILYFHLDFCYVTPVQYIFICTYNIICVPVCNCNN